MKKAISGKVKNAGFQRKIRKCLATNDQTPTFAAPKSSLSSVFTPVNIDIGFGSIGNKAGTLSPKKYLKWLKKLLAM